MYKMMHIFTYIYTYIQLYSSRIWKRVSFLVERRVSAFPYPSHILKWLASLQREPGLDVDLEVRPPVP